VNTKPRTLIRVAASDRVEAEATLKQLRPFLPAHDLTLEDDVDAPDTATWFVLDATGRPGVAETSYPAATFETGKTVLDGLANARREYQASLNHSPMISALSQAAGQLHGVISDHVVFVHASDFRGLPALRDHIYGRAVVSAGESMRAGHDVMHVGDHLVARSTRALQMASLKNSALLPIVRRHYPGWVRALGETLRLTDGDLAFVDAERIGDDCGRDLGLPPSAVFDDDEDDLARIIHDAWTRAAGDAEPALAVRRTSAMLGDVVEATPRIYPDEPFAPHHAESDDRWYLVSRRTEFAAYARYVGTVLRETDR